MEAIWKQDPEANIWTQEGWEWGMQELAYLLKTSAKGAAKLNLPNRRTYRSEQHMFHYHKFIPEDFDF